MTESMDHIDPQAAARESSGGFSLPRIATRIFGTPLLIQPDKLDVILSALEPRLLGRDKIGAFDMEPFDDGDHGIMRHENGVAVIQVLGTLIASPSGVRPISGMTSYGEIGDAFTKAVDDPAVKSILFEFDSPGGEANGAFDLADMIFAARGSKRIWSVANEMALSAAYALASSTHRIILSRTASVGSVGVVAAHVDQSARDKDAGLKFSFIFAGDRKVDGNPHERLSQRARDDIQEKVDTIFDIFAAGVARGRGMTVDAVAATQAAIFMGDDAVSARFADSLGVMDDVLADLVSQLSTTKTFADSVGVRFDNGSASAVNPKRGDSAPPKSVKKELPMTDETKAEVTTSDDAADTSNTAVKEAAAKAPAAEIVDIEKVRKETRAAAIADVSGVLDLCALAGMPECAKGFIAEGLDDKQVREKLLQLRAEKSEGEEVVSRHAEAHGDASDNFGWDRAFARVAGQRMN